MSSSPHTGRFRLVKEKSDWSNGKLPVNMSLTIDVTVDGDDFEYHAVNDTNPDNLYLVDFKARLDGKPYPSTGRGIDSVSLKRLFDDEYQLLKTKEGAIIATEYWRYLEDNSAVVKHGMTLREDGVLSYVEYFQRL